MVSLNQATRRAGLEREFQIHVPTAPWFEIRASECRGAVAVSRYGVDCGDRHGSQGNERKPVLGTVVAIRKRRGLGGELGGLGFSVTGVLSALRLTHRAMGRKGSEGFGRGGVDGAVFSPSFLDLVTRTVTGGKGCQVVFAAIFGHLVRCFRPSLSRPRKQEGFGGERTDRRGRPRGGGLGCRRLKAVRLNLRSLTGRPESPAWHRRGVDGPSLAPLATCRHGPTVRARRVLTR